MKQSWKNYRWQIYWPCWYYLPWHLKSYDPDYGIYFNTGGFSIFQFAWWSND